MSRFTSFTVRDPKARAPLAALVIAFIWGGSVAMRMGQVADPPVYAANLEGIYAAIGHLGDPAPAIAVGIALLVATRRSARATALWVGALGCGGAIEHTTKILTGTGYPSGHTLGAVMIAAILATTGRAGVIAGAAWIGAMGITQVAVGAHLAIDIVGGLALGGLLSATWWRYAGSPRVNTWCLAPGVNPGASAVQPYPPKSAAREPLPALTPRGRRLHGASEGARG